MKKLYAVLATVATVCAVALSTSACFFFMYQPKEPACLQKIE